jgi:hypothetical protein
MLAGMGDVHTNMMGDSMETKNLPGGYAPAAVPFSDRTGTQKEGGESSGEETATEEGGESTEGTGDTKEEAGGSTTTARRSTAKSKAADSSSK